MKISSPLSVQSIPYPTAPQWRRILKLVFRPIDYLEDYYQEFGDFWAVGNPDTPLVYVNHPQAIQQIFNAPPEQFKSGQGNQILKSLLGEHSLVLLDGVSHQRQRKLLKPPFQGETLQNYRHLIQEITQEVTQSWQQGTTFRVRPVMQEITLKVILKVVFGLSSGARFERLQHLLTTLLESTSSPLSSSLLFFRFLRQDWGKWSPWGRFLEMKAQVDRLLGDEIDERRQHKELKGNDILTLLIQAKDENGQGMTKEELRDELMTLLIAGHETTASGLTWVMYWLHFLPEIEQKVRQEQKELQSNGRFPYLEATCLEALRIYPVTLTSFPRILTSPLEIMGYVFPANSALLPCIYLVHHREDIYPQSYQFQPERFLNCTFSPYEYLPFGGGSRRCIGSGLALLEMQTVLATLLSQFRFSLTSSRPLRPVRRGLTLAPPAYFKMKIVD